MSQKRPKVSFSQKNQELVLLWIKDNFVALFHDMSMKNSKEKKDAAWKDLLSYANDLLEQDKPGSNKVKDIPHMKNIVNTGWRGSVRKLLAPYKNTGNGGPKDAKALTANQRLIEEILVLQKNVYH